MDILNHNQEFWDNNVEKGDRWTLAVSSEQVKAARNGDWSIVLTATIPVPKDWFLPLLNCDVLCLASGGGQQGPILAAAGANVTVYDYSPKQLEQDRLVADRDGLELKTIQGDMRDLSTFEDESFDLIFHPCSNVFCEEILPVWKEAYRVLRSGGVLLSGFSNPIAYMFDNFLMDETGELRVKYKLPFADHRDLTPEDREKHTSQGLAYAFAHSLDDQIGGQIDAGFAITGFFEDNWSEAENHPLGKYTPLFMATRALKP